MHLAREWTGEYWHDVVTADLVLPRIPFKAQFRKSVCGGFRGEIEDDPALGMPYLARVRGRLGDGGLAFRKIYSKAPYTVMGPVGRETFDEYITRAFGSHPALSLFHPPIYYFGHYCSDLGTFEGTWTINPEIIPLSDGRFLRKPRSRGRFMIERKMPNQALQPTALLDRG
jgi:hypothetical protein